MSEENKNTEDIKRRVRIVNSWNYINAIDGGFFGSGDHLSNPISAAVSGRAFPDGTIVDLSILMLSIMKFALITPFEEKALQDRDEHYNDLRNELRDLAGEISVLISQLFSKDFGGAKGFSCINDYATALNNVEQETWLPLRDKIRATLPKNLTEDELHQLQADIDNNGKD